MTLRSAFLGAALAIGSAGAYAESVAVPLPGTPTSILLEGMPSFSQRNLEFTGGGKSFCGPTAASNALMWLADRGYPALRPAAANDAIAQKEMIQRLAGLMGTYREGTSLTSFVCGVNTYLRSVGYSPKAWINTGSGVTGQRATPPDINLVRSLATSNMVMWFGLGWYRLDEAKNKFSRDFGHWVTLVGYEQDPQDETGAAICVIADPESPNGHKRIKLNMLHEGMISNGRSRVNAKGYFSITEMDAQPVDRSPRYCLLESIQALTIE